MDPDLLFRLSNTIALAGWLMLIIVPYWKWTSRITTGVVITLLSVLYVSLLFSALKPGDFVNFSSLSGLKELFASDKAVLTGWVHYLAFDLMAGYYIITNAARYGISRWLLLPCLVFTFMMGPAGLLMYFVIRTFKMKSYFEPEGLNN